MRFARILAIVVGSALLGLTVLWTVGPHSKPGSSSHGTQIFVFIAVVGVCIMASRRMWRSSVSH